MSTLTSADFGELKRPTTRVHAPPGGKSSWDMTHCDTQPPAQKARTETPQSLLTETGAFGHINNGAQGKIAPATQVNVPAVAEHAAQLRIALIKTTTDGEIVNLMAQNCWNKLQNRSGVTTEVFSVSNVEELPYASNKLLQFGGFDGVICFGFLNTNDAVSNALATCLTQAFIDISVKNVKPVARAVFMGEPRVAGVKAKSGWGEEFAANISGLIRLGGFLNRDTGSRADGGSPNLEHVLVETNESNSMDTSDTDTPMQQAQPIVPANTYAHLASDAQENFRPKFQQHSKRKQYGAGESSVVFG
uniref:6,7-dimethyl-8-ribityllumazine synthase n=1 Tax=Albugo laibachii Nc14 TaxID=890382 RepID=F0X265_9STRA|nr:conserved hypothetical protein [Albugo laibachii Nc14]|eukprot:CCA27940.1 conserved hypothetical protein [Albugo laibachii Nc14]